MIFWGGPLGDLGLQLSRVRGLFCFSGGLLGGLASSCRDVGCVVSLAFRGSAARVREGGEAGAVDKPRNFGSPNGGSKGEMETKYVIVCIFVIYMENMFK